MPRRVSPARRADGTVRLSFCWATRSTCRAARLPLRQRSSSARVRSRARSEFLPLVPKEFTEPVALLSTRPADLPLPRTALGRSFDLLAVRARCVEEAMGGSRPGQGRSSSDWRSLRRTSCSRHPPDVDRRREGGRRGQGQPAKARTCRPARDARGRPRVATLAAGSGNRQLAEQSSSDRAH